MEATATDVSHIAELDAFIAVNRRWFPEVFIITKKRRTLQEGNAYHNASPWSSRPICLVGTHGQRLEKRPVNRKLTACISSIPLVWKP